MRGPAEGLEDGAEVDEFAEPHVGDLNHWIFLISGAKEDIFWLEVTVANILAIINEVTPKIKPCQSIFDNRLTLECR